MAVILVHGLRTSSTMWRHQVEALREQGVEVVAIDLPGHGSRIGERFTLPAAHEAITAAVNQSAGKPYLCGFSLGGYIAIDWVAKNPGRVSGLLAASCGTTPNRFVLGAWRLLARGIHALPDRGRALNDFMVRLFVPSPGAEDVLAGGVALEVMDDVLREVQQLKPVPSLRRIREPVLFVNGRLDHFRVHARRYFAATRNARAVTLPRTTHMVNVVRPERFTELLLQEYRRVRADD